MAITKGEVWLVTWAELCGQLEQEDLFVLHSKNCNVILTSPLPYSPFYLSLILISLVFLLSFFLSCVDSFKYKNRLTFAHLWQLQPTLLRYLEYYLHTAATANLPHLNKTKASERHLFIFFFLTLQRNWNQNFILLQTLSHLEASKFSNKISIKKRKICIISFEFKVNLTSNNCSYLIFFIFYLCIFLSAPNKMSSIFFFLSNKCVWPMVCQDFLPIRSHQFNVLFLKLLLGKGVDS